VLMCTEEGMYTRYADFTKECEKKEGSLIYYTEVAFDNFMIYVCRTLARELVLGMIPADRRPGHLDLFCSHMLRVRFANIMLNENIISDEVLNVGYNEARIKNLMYETNCLIIGS